MLTQINNRINKINSNPYKTNACRNINLVAFSKQYGRYTVKFTFEGSEEIHVVTGNCYRDLANALSDAYEAKRTENISHYRALQAMKNQKVTW